MNARYRAAPAKPVINLRRLYVDCRFGQLHVRSAFPSSGGFDELTPLLCLHQSPMSSRTFRAFLAPMAADRSVFAPDTPGFGESDAPPSQPAIADYAGAMLDFMDQMRLRQVDLLGYHTGSAIAAEMALAQPERIRRIVMVAVPVLNAEERAAFDASPWPAPIREDGAHLAAEWQRSLRWRGPGVTLEQLAASFAEKLRNGPQAWWGAHAAVHWPAAERLPRLTQPVLVLRPRDDLWEATQRARALLRQAAFKDLEDYGFGVFDVAPEVIVREARDFLA
jgi:pimeloyl-ACP methyl ester carboxylesterase